jgi:hypothetical protein
MVKALLQAIIAVVLIYIAMGLEFIPVFWGHVGIVFVWIMLILTVLTSIAKAYEESQNF